MDASNTPFWRREYALRDHLGNTRLLFADKNGNGIVEITSNASTNEILQEQHYYPFGLSYSGSHWMNDAARDNKYQYNGKEIQDDWSLNWYAYGARYYDAALGRFNGVDPLADYPKQVGTSPYAFVHNNPIRYVDPTGMIWEDPKQAERLTKSVNNRIEGIEKNSVKIQAKIDEGG